MTDPEEIQTKRSKGADDREYPWIEYPWVLFFYLMGRQQDLGLRHYSIFIWITILPIIAMKKEGCIYMAQNFQQIIVLSISNKSLLF